VSVLVEDESGAREVPVGLGTFVDVNVGMDRTGKLGHSEFPLRKFGMSQFP
jgi:hypothetical protein